MSTPNKALDQKIHTSPWRDAWKDRRLRDVIRECFPGLSSRNAFLVITNGLITTEKGDVLKDADTIVPEGETLKLDYRHGVHGRGEPDKPHLHERMRVMHDDAHVVVVAKRAYTLVQPTDLEQDDKDKQRSAPLVELLKHYWRSNKQPIVNPILVQRLDLQTSGLLVLGKTEDAAKHLQKQLSPPRQIRREYIALVAGKFIADAGVWKTWMGRGKVGMRQSVGEGSKKPQNYPDCQIAETHYKVLERYPKATLLELKLTTGRTHQIRIHCAEAGHPVLGDEVYQRLAQNTIERLASKKMVLHTAQHPAQEVQKLLDSGITELSAPKRKAGRTQLHAIRLSFIHPETRKRMNFEDPLPEDMEKFLSTLRRDAGHAKPGTAPA